METAPPLDPPTTPLRPDALIGRRLAERYQITRLIARGGMGAVYEAVQHPLGRAVAVKVLQPVIGKDEAQRASFQERFNLEAASLARLSHANIVTIHDYGQTEEGLWYLVMERVEGDSLARTLQTEGPLAPERTLHLMIQVCRGLRHAHRRGVIHRDLKPSNLLVDLRDDGEELVKVVDFGLVKLSREDQSVTRDGTILGSPHCMSPEQVQGEPVDERTDIYAVGVLLFRCIAGQFPFHGQTGTATMVAHVQHPIPSLVDIMPEERIPPGLEDVIHRCLQKDPANRYPDVRALLDDLSRLAAVPPEEFSTVSSLMLPPARPASGARRWWVAAAVAIILAVVVAVALHTLRGSPGPASPVPSDPAPPVAGGAGPVPSGADEPSAAEGPPSEPLPILGEPLDLRITSEPAGAVVSVDGTPIGTTPFDYQAVLRSRPDVRRLQFELEGYRGATLEVDLARLEEPTLLAELEPAPGSSRAPATDAATDAATDPATDPATGPSGSSGGGEDTPFTGRASKTGDSPAPASQPEPGPESQKEPEPEPEPESTPDGYKKSPYGGLPPGGS